MIVSISAKPALEWAEDFVDEEEIFSGTGCVCVEAGRGVRTDSGVDPEGRNHGADLLPLEGEVRGPEVDQVRQIKQLRDENTRLKQLVAELTLDKTMLQDVLSKKW